MLLSALGDIVVPTDKDLVVFILQTSDSSPSDRTSKKSTPESSRTTPIEPLRIKVEDEDYFPDNEGIRTPDSSQPSPKSKPRKIKGIALVVHFLCDLFKLCRNFYLTILNLTILKISKSH